MNSKISKWSKKELQVYILLLCANADNVETEKELRLIRSKADEETFEKIYSEFSNDSEEERFSKINLAINFHEYSVKELMEFKGEIYEIFYMDCDFSLMERNLDRILDNILY